MKKYLYYIYSFFGGIIINKISDIISATQAINIKDVLKQIGLLIIIPILYHVVLFVLEKYCKKHDVYYLFNKLIEKHISKDICRYVEGQIT